MALQDYIDIVLENDLLTAISLLTLSLLGAKVLYFILETYISRLTKATKTTLDDELLYALKKPIYVVSIVVGVYFSLLQVEMLVKYSETLQKTFVLAMLAVGAFTLSRLISTLINWYATNLSATTKNDVVDHFMPIIRKIVSIFIYVLCIILILDQIGIKVTALVASLGVASLAIALALQETLSNFFAGIYIMADKPVKPGDYVKLETSEEGTVQDIGWRSTKIKTGSGNILIIPNSKLAQNRIVNYNLPIKETSFSLQCAVSYDSDLEKVEKIAKSIASKVLKSSEGAVKEFEPQVFFTSFGESNINFTASFKATGFADKAQITHDFIKETVKEFKKEKIEISFPTRKVLLHKS
ncbi:mechanosensitive ion channel family protein [Candidatus Woesearchaeota archaeon]|nr:mechanosensitive ion channel family protein [Candidatus Woesearchaeota archaeon]